jgi:hypothetical protein
VNAPFISDTEEDEIVPCEWCGLTIDHHLCVDTPEGPEFHCDEIEMGAADIMRRWELADPRDRWKHIGEPASPAHVRKSDVSEKPKSATPYRTPQSTIEAFLFVARTYDTAYVKRWLERHPQDAATLAKIWKARDGHK